MSVTSSRRYAAHSRRKVGKGKLGKVNGSSSKNPPWRGDTKKTMQREEQAIRLSGEEKKGGQWQHPRKIKEKVYRKTGVGEKKNSEKTNDRRTTEAGRTWKGKLTTTTCGD